MLMPLLPTCLPAECRCLLLLRLQKKKRTHQPASTDPAKKGDPKSFVFRRGRHGVRTLRPFPRPAGVACTPCATIMHSASLHPNEAVTHMANCLALHCSTTLRMHDDLFCAATLPQP